MSRNKNLPYKLSIAASYALHPVLIPLYIILWYLFSGAVPTAYLAPQVKNYLTGLVIIDTVFIPVVAVVLMRLLRLIPDYSMTTARERMLPLLILTLCYILCAWTLAGFPAGIMVRRIAIAAAGCTVVSLATGLFWNISHHTLAAGAAAGFFALLLPFGSMPYVIAFCISLVLAGALGSARVYLGRNTVAQVAVGFLAGFLISCLILSLRI